VVTSCVVTLLRERWLALASFFWAVPLGFRGHDRGCRLRHCYGVSSFKMFVIDYRLLGIKRLIYHVTKPISLLIGYWKIDGFQIWIHEDLSRRGEWIVPEVS